MLLHDVCCEVDKPINSRVAQGRARNKSLKELLNG